MPLPHFQFIADDTKLLNEIQNEFGLNFNKESIEIMKEMLGNDLPPTNLIKILNGIKREITLMNSNQR